MRAVLASALLSLAAATDILESTGCDLQQGGSCAAELLQVQVAKHAQEQATEEEFEGEIEDDAEPPRFCRDGIRNHQSGGGRICCPRSCGTCGGSGCGGRPGGTNRCCAGRINERNRVCSGPSQTACVIPRVNDDEHRRRRTGGGHGPPEPEVEAPAVAPVDPHPPIEILPEVVEELALCDPGNVDLSTATVVHSNLGGAGPDGGEPTLVFGNVKPGVNLKVSVTSAYTPNMLNPSGGVLRNGLHNGFGRINLAATPDGAANDFVFTFVDAATGAAVEMDPFVMTFFDSDHGKSQGSREFIKVDGFASYQLHEDTDITAVDVTPTSATFSSVLHGNKADNPESPFSLTPLQQKKSFAVMFEGANEFLVSLRASGFANPQGRNIFFAGKSAMVCGNRAKCSSHVCESGALVPEAEFTLCAGVPCTAADEATCCVAEPVRPCCRAMTPQCLACSQGVTVQEWCEDNSHPQCPSDQTTTEYQYVYPSTTTPNYIMTPGPYGPPPGYGGYGPGSNGGWR